MWNANTGCLHRHQNRNKVHRDVLLVLCAWICFTSLGLIMSHLIVFYVNNLHMLRVVSQSLWQNYYWPWPKEMQWKIWVKLAANAQTDITKPTVYPKKYAHSFCFVVLCCGYTLTDFPISIRLTSLALWQSNDCPSASKATLMNMDKYFMWIHYERLHNHNKAKHNKNVCIFLGIYCMCNSQDAFCIV